MERSGGKKKLPELIKYIDGLKSYAGSKASLIPTKYFNTVGEMLAVYQKAFTNDRNIPNDSEWAFHTVSFNTRGGSKVSPAFTLTIENGKAANWPTSDSVRMGDTFLGWYDTAKDGNKLTKNSDLTKMAEIYAHWESDEKPPEPPVPGPDSYDFFTRLETELPATGFSSEFFTPLRERPREAVYGTTEFTLQIPELNVAETILAVPFTDGNYPMEWLRSEISLLEGSSLPGEGITVMTGHNHLNTTETGPFLFIGTLEEGDHVMISGADNAMLTYKVYGNYKIASDGFAEIADNVRENALVLITCEDESVNGGYLNRRVILAEPL